MTQKKIPAMKGGGIMKRIQKDGKHRANGASLPDVRGVSLSTMNAAAQATSMPDRLSPVRNWLQQSQTVALLDAFRLKGALVRTPRSRWAPTPFY